MTDKKHALYLFKEGEAGPRLFAADDVEAAQANGWKQPDFKKSNGTDWNHEDDLEQQDAAAEVMRVKSESQAKRDAEKVKAEAKPARK